MVQVPDAAILARNLAALPQALRAQLGLLETLQPLEVMPCRKVKGAVTAQVATRDGKKHLLHSKYDPCKEGTKQAEVCAGRSWVFMVGFGLGYLIEAAQDQLAQNARMTVVVPDLQNLWTALHWRDLSGVFADSRLQWLIASEPQALLSQVSKRYREFDEARHVLLVLQPAIQSLSEDFATLSYIFRRRTIEKQTISKNREMILSNIEANLTHILRCPGVSHLANTMAGQPVVVAASGPSLDQQMPWLRQQRASFRLIAVSSALHALQRAGIEADVVVCIDPKPNIVTQLRDCWHGRTVLVATSAVSPSIFQIPFFRTYVAYSSGDPLMQGLEQQVPRGFLETGGSAANAALALAKIMGSRKVALVGQDLALDHAQQTHANHVVTKHDETPTSFDKIQVQDVFGGKVTTLKKWFHYLEWIEWFAKGNPQLQLAHCADFGAQIRGLVHQRLPDWLRTLGAGSEALASEAAWLKVQDHKVDQAALRQLRQWFQQQIQGIA